MKHNGIGAILTIALVFSVHATSFAGSYTGFRNRGLDKAQGVALVAARNRLNQGIQAVKAQGGDVSALREQRKKLNALIVNHWRYQGKGDVHPLN